MNRRRHVLSIFLFMTLAWVCIIWAAAQEQPLDNAQIIQLTKLEMGDTVIIAKIKSAKEISFDTSTGGLVKLKEAGVSNEVIAAMLERLTPQPDAPAQAAGEPDLRVLLECEGGSIELTPIYGIVKTKAAFVTVVQWMEFNDLFAEIRIRDRRPTILITWDKDPRGAWWWVKVSQNKDKDDQYRYFDLEGGGFFSSTWSGSPEKGSIVKCEATEEQPGLWRLTPLKELKPGEYGLFSGVAASLPLAGLSGPGRSPGEGLLFGFGIDK